MVRTSFGVVVCVVAGVLLGVTLAAGVLMFGPETVLEHW